MALTIELMGVALVMLKVCHELRTIEEDQDNTTVVMIHYTCVPW